MSASPTFPKPMAARPDTPRGPQYPAGTDTCPRCGGGFHCGAQDAQPCPCGGLTLSPLLQAQLRQRYALCLCLGCLTALAQGAPLDLATPQ